jgi:hypothetical protein
VTEHISVGLLVPYEAKSGQKWSKSLIGKMLILANKKPPYVFALIEESKDIGWFL